MTANRKKTISIKLLSFYVPLICFGLALVFTGLEFRNYQTQINFLRNNMESFATTQATVLGPSIWHLDNATLEILVTVMAQNHNVHEINVIDLDGKVIAQKSAHPFTTPPQKISTERPIVFSSLEITQTVGNLIVTFHTNHIWERLKQRLVVDLIVLASLCGLLIVTTLLLTRRIISVPLDKLHKSIMRMKLENVREPVDWQSQDELGEVVEAYNEIQKTLYETQSSYKWAAEIGKLGHYVWDDINNQCNYCSPELAQIYEMTPEKFIEISQKHNMNLQLVHPDDQEMYSAIVYNLDQDINVVFRIYRKDGSIGYFQEYGHRIRDENGKALKTNGIIRDVTDEKMAEQSVHESEKLLRTITDTLPALVSFIDCDQRYRFNNMEYKVRYGLSPEKLKGQKVIDVLGPDTYKRLQPYIERALSGEIVNYLDDALDSQGNRWCTMETRIPTRDENGVVRGIITVAFDVTDLKQAEDVAQAALANAEQANQAKSEFLATMSHEFRTPLNAILGFSEMMRAQYFGPLGSNNYKDYANDIHNSGEHMLALVNDVLDIAAIEAGKRPIIKEMIAMDDVLKNCVRKIQSAADNNGIILSLTASHDLPEIYADKRSVIQIILNILSNAVKFTERDGTISISTQVENNKMILSVSDTGIGIPADRLAVITEPFAQANSNPHNAQEGTGLGLSIVESLIDAHDGSLHIESEVGKGTVITVKFPTHTPVIK